MRKFIILLFISSLVYGCTSRPNSLIQNNLKDDDKISRIFRTVATGQAVTLIIGVNDKNVQGYSHSIDMLPGSKKLIIEHTDPDCIGVIFLCAPKNTYYSIEFEAKAGMTYVIDRMTVTKNPDELCLTEEAHDAPGSKNAGVGGVTRYESPNAKVISCGKIVGF